ncbi:RNA polymerase sigma factor [Streptomyces spiralis]
MTAVTEVVRPSAVEDDVTALQASVHAPERFAVIFDRHFTEIRSYVARRLSADIADDITVEVFLAAFHKRRGYDPAQGSPRSWLYGFATLEVSTHRRAELRRYRTLARLSAEPPPYQARDAMDAEASRHLSAELANALAGPSAKDRDVLLLVALAELSYDEVAAALAIPYGTVCSRLNRARRRLAQALARPDGRTRAQG